MNIKDFTAIVEKIVRTQMPYGYDNTDSLLIGINIDGNIRDIESISVVSGGIVINPKPAEQAKQQIPKLLQTQKKSKKEETTQEGEQE